MGYYFSENLKRYRENKGLTQEALARKMHVSRSAVALWEHARRYPTIDKVYDLATVLKVPVEKLLCNAEND